MTREQSSTRKITLKSLDVSPLSTRSNTPSEQDEAAGHDRPQPNDSVETCPSCSKDAAETFNAFEKENWIRCDVCKIWYHWRCAGNGGDVDTIDKWYCKTCMETDPSRIITIRGPARKSSRKRTHRDYASLNSGEGSNANRWIHMLEGKVIQDDPFKRMEGRDVNLSWLEEIDEAMREPIVVENVDGLGMKMPPEDFTVEDVAEMVGKDTPVEVIDVASQSTAPGWTLGKWAEYFNLESSKRDKILNVISLEVSGTKLSDMILPPKIVRELDWVENYWPSTRKGKGHTYPKVQLYCLMGVATAWTDWHIDFAGSSVYYHILHGTKVFYFIKPTRSNLAAYEQWSGTELQNHTWLGDMVDEVYKVELSEGNTMIIPTGWIHAVYTPVDTLVFGGNFLHSYDVSTQLRVRGIEIATQVPKKFRFPMFSKLCWYVGDRYLRDLKSQSGFSCHPRVLSSIAVLADFLVSEVRILERGSEQAKKEVKDQIPADRIKDAPAMARELRWRIKLASGYLSDDEGGTRKSKAVAAYPSVNGTKRKRIDAEEIADDVEGPSNRFKNFKPKSWDAVLQKVDELRRKDKASRPRHDPSWTQVWLADRQGAEDIVEEAEVKTCREVVVKVRHTAKGIERQRIERQVEDWVWNGDDRMSD